MAQVDETAGVPTVAPDATPPDRYQRINASPDQFGAQIGEGLQKVGSGASTAGKFFGQVAADDTSNQYQEFATKLLHGDPSKQAPGPDGTMQPDTGYMGLRGDAALRARPGVEQQLDEKLKELRGNLSSPEQQLEFDNFSRRYRAGVTEKIGTHADQQATTWYQGVNTATSKLALDHIANNADNPNEVAAGAADLAHSYVKNAQLAGASEGSPQIAEAVASAKRDALQAQLNAIAVKDPSRAMAILDKNKAIAGVQYDNLAAQYRGRAKQQQGYDVADQTIRNSYTNNPAPNPVTLTNAGAQYGVSGSYLMRVHQIEDPHNSQTENGEHAAGPFQFVPSTAKQYGLSSADRFDPQKSADAAARLAADNRVSLTSSLGRPPTDAELYLAHQQGAGGAAKLLSHPTVRAGDLVGDKYIRENGGDPNAPAVNFTSMWTNKFNGAPVAAAGNRKAQVIGDILAIPDDQIDPDVRQHAITRATQTLSAQQIAEEQDSKSKKAASDQRQSDLTSRIIKGDTNGIVGEIADDPTLSSAEKQNLYKFAIGDGGVSDPLQYGPAYTSTINRILAKPDDPGKINDPAEIIRMGADGELTKKGVGELLTTMDKIKKQPDQAGIATVKASQLKYYQSKMAIDDEMSAVTGKPFKNQKGLDRYNHDFVPAFESAYSQWIAKGNDPMEFLGDGKKMDAIMDRVYPPSERAKDAISGGDVKPDMTIPPVPDGLNKNTFETIVKHPPVGVDGKQWTPTAFATAIDRLRADPTPETRAAFDRWFGKAGFRAEEILKKLPPKPQKDADAGPIDKLIADNPAGPVAANSPEPTLQTVGVRG